MSAKDWKQVARGLGLDVPESDLDRYGPVLDAMEKSFRPLAESLPPDIEPAVTFRCPAEDEA